jgi:hypothetical protein
VDLIESFPFVWTETALAIAPMAGQTWRTLPWREVQCLAAVRPWPCFRVVHAGASELLAPHGRAALVTMRRAAFAAAVEKLFVYAAPILNKRLMRGWLDAPQIEWERVESMPSLVEPISASGAYREGRPLVEEIATACRPAPDPLEAMVQWLASGPDKPWREHPREVRTSAEFVYVLRRDRSTWRIPIAALSDRRGGGDAFYVFGRSTELLLPQRNVCPVRQILDARLATLPPDPIVPDPHTGRKRRKKRRR